jgi:hypothetical protein
VSLKQHVAVLSCGWGEDFELARRKRRAAPTELTVFFVAMRLGEDLGAIKTIDGARAGHL